jgi:hypothetical protein
MTEDSLILAVSCCAAIFIVFVGFVTIRFVTMCKRPQNGAQQRLLSPSYLIPIDVAIRQQESVPTQTLPAPLAQVDFAESLLIPVMMPGVQIFSPLVPLSRSWRPSEPSHFDASL